MAFKLPPKQKDCAFRVKVAPQAGGMARGGRNQCLLANNVLPADARGYGLLAVGRHPRKLATLAKGGIETRLASDPVEGEADVPIEATGSATGFATARSWVRPGGTMVLKRTFHGGISLDASGIVVDEIPLVGSRCGPFPPALDLLSRGLIEVEPLIHGVFPLDHGLAAFEEAASGALKVLLSM